MLVIRVKGLGLGCLGSVEGAKLLVINCFCWSLGLGVRVKVFRVQRFILETSNGVKSYSHFRAIHAYILNIVQEILVQ